MINILPDAQALNLVVSPAQKRRTDDSRRVDPRHRQHDVAAERGVDAVGEVGEADQQTAVDAKQGQQGYHADA